MLHIELQRYGLYAISYQDIHRKHVVRRQEHIRLVSNLRWLLHHDDIRVRSAQFDHLNQHIEFACNSATVFAQN